MMSDVFFLCTTLQVSRLIDEQLRLQIRHRCKHNNNDDDDDVRRLAVI